MRILRRRFWIGLTVVLSITFIVLTALELARRRQFVANGQRLLDGSGTAVSEEELEEKYHDSKEFAKLCARVEERYDALRGRSLGLGHTRKARLIEYDKKGRTIAIMETTDRVGFDERGEHTVEIERRQVLGEPFRVNPDVLTVGHPSKNAALPFSKDTLEGLYLYRLEGVERVQGITALRIHFEPTRPIERSLKGSAWIDPTTFEPIRMQASAATPRLGIDRFEMIVDYGRSENGHNQIRHFTVDAAGGFLFVSRHYRVDADLSAYGESEK